MSLGEDKATMRQEVRKRNLVPPDGGWGWIICLAYALNNIIVLPLISGFGLVFQESFATFGITATQGSTIINLNHGFGMLLSFFNGPLLHRLGYRKVAVAGALFVAVGVILTSWARSFWQFILWYSLFTSIGVALVMAAFTLAINSFFKEKRGRAIGLGMSITGLGPILMPQLINLLINIYGVQGAVLILGGLCLHSLVAALLLRPAKWYLKEAPKPDEEMVLIVNPPAEGASEDIAKYIEVTDGELIYEDVGSTDKVITQNGKPLRTASAENFSEDENDYLESSVRYNQSMTSLGASVGNISNERMAISHPDFRKLKAEPTPIVDSHYKWWESQEINLGSSINIFNERQKETPEVQKSQANISRKLEYMEPSKTFFQKFVEFFDLTLLNDPIFVNILFGISIAACAEINFSLLTPFILKDFNFDTAQIAAIMSVIGFSDVLFRFVSPFVGERFKKSPRIMYLGSLVMIILTRFTLFFTSTYWGMLLVALAIGIAKGVRTVYMNLVIPTYVPIERLAFASSIQMLINGVILMTLGPILGYIRDRSGSYTIPIFIINFVTFITIVLWTVEFVYFKDRSKSTMDERT